ncbi:MULTISPECIES: hypothetical protein [unclassified Paenibacillus]|uniref:hypothetical protein n=1 Tax=unclassified Paenibacillus TaxID=185978 RepID=UPI00020D727B|nr:MULTISPECIES: hypothetical protein [unclassified Paenibacillus]EGL17499.1 hypothetical protein HMPREF9413_5379 [Paenibacillus sp. HGF7]EPD81292.1 hypothetical protein HMPREF1207_05049 [Paenibacillus sp. HGH0039]
MIEVNLKALEITSHAIERAKERFNILNELDIVNMCKTIIKTGVYIGEITCEKGNKSHLFASGKKGAIISQDLSKVVTVIEYRRGHIPDLDKKNPLHNKLVALYHSEMKRLTKLEQSLLKKLKETKLYNDIEIAELNLKLYKTRSEKTKKEVEQRIAEIKNKFEEQEFAMKQIESDKRIIAKSMACLT